MRVPAASHFEMSAWRCREQRRRQREQHQRAQRDAFFHQFAHRHDGRAVAVGGVDRDGRIHGHQFQRGRDIAAEIDIDDAIDAALPGKGHRLGDDILGPVVDDEIGAAQAAPARALAAELTVAITCAPPHLASCTA